jgi:O-methyltransferase involved in polyketide biosynthesis
MQTISYDELPPVAKTLIIPLGCRAREFGRSDAIVNDLEAFKIFEQVPGAIKAFKGVGRFDQAAILMRARQFDTFARNFLGLHPDGLVVDIGCGLDTRFSRLDNGRMHWLGLDLPTVIELRQSLIPNGKRNQTLAGSVFDLTWLDEVERYHKPVIFLAEAVFPYFPEREVRKVLSAIVKRFRSAEIVIDIFSSRSVNIHNHTSGILKKTGARLNWSVDDPYALEKWGLKLVDVWGYFDHKEPRLGIENLMRFVPAWRDANRVVLYQVAG